MLTDDQIQTFNNDGFLVLNDFFKPIMNDIVDMTESIRHDNSYYHYYEYINDKKILCRTENFSHSVYHIIKQIEPLVSQLFGEQATLFKEKINYKQAGGGAFSPHQDEPAYAMLGQKLHITVAIACDKMNVENGCLEFSKGKHKFGILPQTENGSLSGLYEWVPAECDAGSIIIFSSYAPHRSGINSSSTERRAWYITFNALSDGGNVHQTYYDLKDKYFPPDSKRIMGQTYSSNVFNLATPIN